MTIPGSERGRGWILPVLCLILSAGVVYLAFENVRLKGQLSELGNFHLVPREIPAALPGTPAPPFEVLLPDGSQLTLRTDSLEAPLVFAWLSANCEPCRKARVGWNTLADLFPGQVWAVSLDPPGHHDTAFSSDIVRFPVVTTVAGEAPRAYEIQLTPSTVFVQADGTIGKVWHGPLTDAAIGEIIARLGQPFAERR